MSVIPKNERRALRRAVGLLEIDKSRFAWSVAAGSGAVGSGIGLSAVSAWLIARAAQLPPVLDLSVAATSVRAFGVGKAVFRYLERISSHWVALYGMSNLRTSVYASLADSPTDVVTSVRRGDLLARTGADVDEVGDVVVKSLLPAAVAVIVGIISVAIVGWLSPLNQATYHMHNFGYDLLPRLWQTYLIFGVAIVLLFVLTLRALRKYNFHFLGGDQ